MKISAAMKKAALSATFVVASAFAFQAASADTITFDDLDGNGHDGQTIIGSYQGFNWSNFYVLNGVGEQPGTGYANGVVSPLNAAYNGFANPAFITASNARPFLFVGGYFTAAFDDPDPGDLISVRLIGSLAGAIIYNLVAELNSTAPTLVDVMAMLHLNARIDSLRVSSINQSQIVMDNLTLITTPIPGALPLFATALGLGAMALRRRKLAKAAK